MAKPPRYRVVVAEAAALDLRAIAAYAARRDSAVVARRLIGRLCARATRLETTPGRGRVVPELAERGITHWREIIAKPHRIIYRVDGREVHIVAVLDGRRDLRELLDERLTR